MGSQKTNIFQVDPFEIGWLFVQEYYTHLNKDPARLHCFYNKKSCFLHGTEGEAAKSYYGQQVCFLLERTSEVDFFLGGMWRVHICPKWPKGPIAH